MGGVTLNLVIGGALLAVDIDAAHKTATNGVLAGIIDTDGLISELKKVAGSFNEDLCSGSTVESIADQLRQASDIMKDGSSGSPDKECDGISIGLGFDMAEAKLGAVAAPAEPQENPCEVDSGGTP